MLSLKRPMIYLLLGVILILLAILIFSWEDGQYTQLARHFVRALVRYVF